MIVKFNWTLKSYYKNIKNYHLACVGLYDDNVLTVKEKAMVWGVLLLWLPIALLGGEPYD